MRSRRLVRGMLAAAILVGLLGAGSVAFFAATRPSPLALTDARPATAPAAAPSSAGDPLAVACPQPRTSRPLPAPAGVWAVAAGSQAGYRAREKWAQLPAPHEAVARTEHVGGWLSVSGGEGGLSIDAGCFAMDLATLQSVDSLPGFRVSDRDRTVVDLLGTATHPVARFIPQPASVGPAFLKGETVRVSVPGVIDVHGVQRPATAVMDVRYDRSSVSAAGSTTVIAEDHGIELPKAADFVTVDSQISIEFALLLRPA